MQRQIFVQDILTKDPQVIEQISEGKRIRTIITEQSIVQSIIHEEKAERKTEMQKLCEELGITWC